jgi:hypothetical protein
MKTKLGTVLLAVALMAGLAAVGPARAMENCPPLGCGTDLSAALDLEQKVIDRHFVWGQVVPVSLAPDKTIANAGGWGDSGLWTGTYLAAESFRYQVAKHHLAENQEDPFWTAQQVDAKARIDKMVAKFHLLTNIAKAWRTTLSPSTSPRPSFGGGVIQGEPGMLMRACAPTDAGPALDIEPNDRVFGPFRWDDGKDYMCETAPSRDTYAGTTFGLLTAFDLVSGDDPAMRALIRDDVLTLANFLVKYGWNYPRPHGQISLPPLGHDFDNFVSPLFVYVPLARLNMAQSARHVADVAGSTTDKVKWNAVWNEELASQGPILAASMEVDAADPNSGYYKFNLHHLTGYTLTRLATDDATRLLFKQALGVMDRTTGSHVNAHFETITYALTGEQRRLDDAILHLRQWRDYRARTEVGGVTDNRSRCGKDLQCVPEDQWNAAIAGQELLTRPGTSSNLRARYPLPVAVRPPTDFLWQRPPTQLNGASDPNWEEVGHDYLVPYWMLRYETEVRPPVLESFPAWPGPAHS